MALIQMTCSYPYITAVTHGAQANDDTMEMMKELENVSLKSYSTMQLGGTARYVAEITSRDELKTAIQWAKGQQLPVIMIGTGSNIFWRDEGFSGLLLVNKIMRYEVIERDDTNIYITVGAGEPWDSVVERTVDAGFSGIEQLSLIPGTAGATPVQNVGAYGREIADVLVSVEVYDTQTDSFTILPKSECQFGYRTSRFKHADKGRFYITALTLHVHRGNPEAPYYQSLERYFAEHELHNAPITPQIMRESVIAIRTSKLPDVAAVPNNGSFFANPIIDENTLIQIQGTHPDVQFWRLGGGSVKVSAAWLIEQAGLKDYHDEATGMATWAKQPLVLVNESATSTQQLLEFQEKIVTAVRERFGVTLEREPELLP